MANTARKSKKNWVRVQIATDDPVTQTQAVEALTKALQAFGYHRSYAAFTQPVPGRRGSYTRDYTKLSLTGKVSK